MIKLGVGGHRSWNNVPRRLAVIWVVPDSASDFRFEESNSPSGWYSFGASYLTRVKSKLILAAATVTSLVAAASAACSLPREIQPLPIL